MKNITPMKVSHRSHNHRHDTQAYYYHCQNIKEFQQIARQDFIYTSLSIGISILIIIFGLLAAFKILLWSE